MAKFFVGQRVRIKWSKGWPELAGQEGVINGLAGNKGIEGVSEWTVAPDIWGSHRAPSPGLNGGIFFAPNSNQLEPLQPDGAQPSVYSFQELMDDLKAGKVTEVV